MTTEAWLWLAAAGVFAVGDWMAVARRNKPLEYVCKPAATALLLTTALALDTAPDLGDRRAWFVAALALSLAGDVFLMLPRDLFVAGLGSFLLAHIAYVIGFQQDGPDAGALAVGAIVAAIIGAAVGSRILTSVRRGPHPELTVPVVAYMLVISAMVASALASGDAVAAVGALTFELSDSLIAWNRFVRPLRWAPVAIMVTYHSGQALLVLSLT
jgi:uncharacterized membrane protein YhhN